jgi:hypothetical protein
MTQEAANDSCAAYETSGWNQSGSCRRHDSVSTSSSAIA